MTTSNLAVAFLVALIIGLVLRRRQQRAATAARLAKVIESLRAAAAASVNRRAAAPDHSVLQRHAAPFAALARELEALGGSILGDVEELHADGSSAGVARWFVDASRTVCGWFTVLDRPEGPMPGLFLFSELVPPQFITTKRGGATLSLAGAPTVHRAFVDGTVPLITVLDQHRARVLGQAPALPKQIDDLAGAHSVVDSLRAHLKQWRAAQDPEGLLALDLRSVLQRSYEELGPGVFKLMRPHVGRAQSAPARRGAA